MLLPATLPFPVMALVQSSASHKLVSDFIIYLFSRCQSFEIKALPVIHVAANLKFCPPEGSRASTTHLEADVSSSKITSKNSYRSCIVSP